MSKEKKIEKIIRQTKVKQIRYQFRMFIFYAFLMALITSHGIESDNGYAKGIFFGLIIVMCVLMIRNLIRWLDYHKRVMELTEDQHEEEEIIVE
jgi:hypothetical protein